jgi:hypothetical protein
MALIHVVGEWRWPEEAKIATNDMTRPPNSMNHPEEAPEFKKQ